MLTWSVEIDWSDTGFYIDEGLLVTGMSWERGRQNYIKTDGTGFEVMQTGQMYITLLNDGRFDPYNSNSELYPYVEPGHFIKVSVSIDGGESIPVFTGALDDIKYVDENHIKFSAAGGMSLLDTEFSAAIGQNINIATAIENILDAVNYPFGDDLEQDTDIIPVWWGEGNAKDEIDQLVQSSLGFFFVAADGKATFQDRHISESGAVVLDDDDIAYEVSLKMPWETRRNKIQIQVHPINKMAGQTVWTLPESIAVSGGESVEIWAEYVDSGGTKIPAADVTVESFAGNSAADGLGTNLSADFDVTLTAFAKTGKLVIENGGENTSYLTSLILSGTAVIEQDPVKIIKENSETQKRLFSMDLAWQQNTNTGIDLAAYLLKSLEDPAANPVVQIEDNFALQFGFELGDLIELTITDKYIVSKVFRVGGISGAWQQEDGQRILSTLYLELLPDVLNQYFVLNVSELDTEELGY